jgi:hypothetical protein
MRAPRVRRRCPIRTAEGPRVKARKGNAPTYSVNGAGEEGFTTDFLADRTTEFITAHRRRQEAPRQALRRPARTAEGASGAVAGMAADERPRTALSTCERVLARDPTPSS